jgi:Arylsulfotransferase (ASST)
MSQLRLEPNTIKRRGTGFRGSEPARSAPGYTLFTPTAGDGLVVLIDAEGSVAHTWNMPYPPGLYGYLTDNGTLFYNGKIPTDSFLGRRPFQGGAAMEVDWNGRVLWEVRQPDHHHDGRLLRNGNVLLLCATALPEEVARQVRGGIPGTEDDGRMYADYLVEMTTSGETIWEWRVWEHLDPATRPITAPGDTRAEWTHGNTVIELPNGKILLSMRNISTIVRIDRQTGQIDWELGPPPLSGAHAVNPLPNGNLLIFDNGPYRVDQATIAPNAAPFSRVIEVDPTTNAIVWTYQEPTAQNFFSALISNAQRLPNGNTLINEGLFGRLFEVTPDGETVWEYVNPYFGSATAPPQAQTNTIFRAYRYTAGEIARAKAV